MRHGQKNIKSSGICSQLLAVSFSHRRFYWKYVQCHEDC